jgi:hypothetical protein
MFGSMVSMLRHPLQQQGIAVANAQQAAARLAHQRRQREETEAYLARLPERSRPLPPGRSPVYR